MDLKKRNSKLILKRAMMIVGIFVLAGISSVFVEQYILPSFRTNKFFSRFEFLKRTAENVTVINKTEQITVKEDERINEISSQATNAVVNILSISAPIKNQPKNQLKDIKHGTGVIVTSDGLIATYRSAINENNATYEIFLTNGMNYEAKLVGIDEFTNLAYLKIEASNLTAIALADSNDFLPGRKLIAIGNSPGEYQKRFSVGFLSGINRNFSISGQTLSSSEKLEGVIEADFDNKKQYLGGPIISYGGEMVGLIGSTIIDNQEKFFEIPSNIMQKSINLAIGAKLDSRPSLGIYYLSLTKEYSVINEISRESGALIYSPSGRQGLAIITGSVAENAGLRMNDIILAVDKQSVNLNNPLSNIVSQYKKGDIIDLTVDRAGNEIKISVKL